MDTVINIHQHTVLDIIRHAKINHNNNKCTLQPLNQDNPVKPVTKSQQKSVNLTE